MTRGNKSICPAPLLVDASAESSKLPLCLLAVMDQFIPELPQIEVSNGGPWLWQARRFQDNAAVILCEIRGQRLQSGRYPTRQEHLSTSTCDAGILVEIIKNWDCGWQVPYVVLRISAHGLYSHPDMRDLAVEGVRVASYVDEVLEFVNGVCTPWASSKAEMCGRNEALWEGDEPHPLIALHEMTEELDNMARAVFMEVLDEP